jgi:hypothetical protein
MRLVRGCICILTTADAFAALSSLAPEVLRNEYRKVQ